MSEYKDTLNLPKTGMPMKYPRQREQSSLDRWRAEDAYGRHLSERAAAPAWSLHDGPPFANGDIHLGHFINKTLKDVSMRFRRQAGFLVPYTPGWDCHGLPIENKVRQRVAGSSAAFVGACAAEAAKWVDAQRQQFQRIGVQGDWDRPYVTMDRHYESAVLVVFARLVELGLVYRGCKPVWWSAEARSALAEAEVEYWEVEQDSFYVAFRSVGDPLHYLAWTTTPWTLPANALLAVNKDAMYAVVEQGGKRFVVADAAVGRVFKGEYRVAERKPGEAFLSRTYLSPLRDKIGAVVHSAHVDEGAGTGVVHIAPGHGAEDYEVGRRHGVDAYCPVSADGRYDDTVVAGLRGERVADSKTTEYIRSVLAASGLLFGAEKISHEYPHDWRSGRPVITRATPQWFVALDRPFGGGPPLRDRAAAACESVRFLPAYGKNRLLAMVAGRPDWCISRQRHWGIPIPAFYRDGEPVLRADWVRAVAVAVDHRGSVAWRDRSPAELAGRAADGLSKETAIFDVWFESGCSWTQAGSYPADVYLEGSDMHRGWFQHSLLLGLAVRDEPPFRSVVTHGFVVGPDGKKLAKSDENYVAAEKEVGRYGADPLRLWACSMDFADDMKSSPEIVAAFLPKFDKIRNTLRFLVANLYDFDPRRDHAPPPPRSLDAWVLARLSDAAGSVTRDCEQFSFHQAFKTLYEFCVADVSAVYGNAMKDRLYCEVATSPARRRTQSAMYSLLVWLTKMLQPMVPFTADEVWECIGGEPPSPPALPPGRDEGVWKLLFDLRADAMTQLERMKRKGWKATEAEVIYKVPLGLCDHMREYGADLEDLVGCGYATVAPCVGEAGSVEVVDRRDDWRQCARSWKRRPDVGTVTGYHDLSERDAKVMAATRQ